MTGAGRVVGECERDSVRDLVSATPNPSNTTQAPMTSPAHPTPVKAPSGPGLQVLHGFT
jgi:hypothetical protein